MRQPALFFGQGSPMNAVWGRTPTPGAPGEAVGKPKGALMVSGHREAQAAFSSSAICWMRT
jgi:4,5-DOPA dioxygenase extradiol